MMGAPTSNHTASNEHGRGIALVLVSACGFGAMAIFAKLAYRADAAVLPLLAARFVLAAVIFWVVVALRRPAWPSLPTMAAGIGLGAAGYALQAGLFFGALTRIDASLASLLLYTYPALVFVTALALGRERASQRRLLALGLASGGATLVLLGAGAGAADGVGVAMGLGAAVAYSAYILLTDRAVVRIDPLLLAALVTTGASMSFVGAGAATGSLDFGFSTGAWLAVAAIAVLSTALPVTAFLLGLKRVGPATASIVSTFEPVVTVGLAMALFGETLAPVQAAGATLVLAAVVLLQRRSSVKADGSATRSTASAPAGALARQLA